MTLKLLFRIFLFLFCQKFLLLVPEFKLVCVKSGQAINQTCNFYSKPCDISHVEIKFGAFRDPFPELFPTLCWNHPLRMLVCKRHI